MQKIRINFLLAAGSGIGLFPGQLLDVVLVTETNIGDLHRYQKPKGC